MALSVKDFIAETTVTTGTGSYTLLGAVAGFRSLNGNIPSGDRVPCTVRAGTEWEEGLYTFSAPSTLARTEILASSNAGNAVNWGAGTKQVSVTLPAAFAQLLLSENTGFLAQTGERAVARRSLAVGAGMPFAWTNPAGAAGNPELSFTSVLAVLTYLGLLGTAAAARDMTSGYTLQPADRGVLQKLTTAAGTLSLLSAATAGAGYAAALINRTGGAVTVARNGSDKINAASGNVTLPNGGMLVLFSDGIDDWALAAYWPGYGTAGEFLKAGGAGVLSSWTAFGTLEASVAQMEAGAASDVYVSPARAGRHPSALQCKGKVSISGGTPTLQAGALNTSIADNGVGDFSLVWTVAFSTANYALVGTAEATTTTTFDSYFSIEKSGQAAGSCRIRTGNSTTGPVDVSSFNFMASGDQ